jgi:hypothetical protein
MFQEEYDVIVVGAGHAGSGRPLPLIWFKNIIGYDEPAEYRANVM